jgi:peptide/nickel transport system substrate-binding protein
MKKYRVLRLASLLLAMVVLFTACGGTTASQSPAPSESSPTVLEDTRIEPTGEPQYGGTLRVTTSSDPGSLDIMLDTSEDTQIPASHIFETLLSVDLAGNAHTGVCSYEESEDGMVLTLTLRDGLTFHNGDPVTIDDIKATIDRWLANVAFAQNAVGSKVESIEYPDDKTVVFTFKEPAPLALQALSSYDRGPYVMPKFILEEAGDGYITEEMGYIGTGPYKFVEWQADRHIKLARFEDYKPTDNDADGMAAPKMAYADEIMFIPVSDKMTRITGVQTGSYDVGIGVPSNMYATMAADPNLAISMTDLGITPGLVFNYLEGPTTDVKLRQAVLACLDMESLMMAAEGDPNFYYLSPCFMPKSSVFYNEAGLEKYQQYDVEAAKALLAESSYAGETLIYVTTKDYDYFYKTALLAADMMRQIGINVELTVVDNPTLEQMRSDPTQYSMFSCGLTAKTDPTLIAFLASDNWAGGYASPGKTELVNKLMSTPGQAERLALWEELSELLYEEVPVITFGERRNAVVTQSNVHGLFEGTKKYYWNTWLS